MATGLLVHLCLISLPVMIKAELLWTLSELLTALDSAMLGGQNNRKDDRKVMSLRRARISEPGISPPWSEGEMLFIFLISLLHCSCFLYITFCIYFPFRVNRREKANSNEDKKAMHLLFKKELCVLLHREAILQVLNIS